MKAQASLEAIMVITIILGMFLIVVVYTIMNDERMRVIKGSNEDITECDRLATAITKAYSSPGNSVILFNLKKPVYIRNRTITILKQGQTPEQTHADDCPECHSCNYFGITSKCEPAEVPEYSIPVKLSCRKFQDMGLHINISQESKGFYISPGKWNIVVDDYFEYMDYKYEDASLTTVIGPFDSDPLDTDGKVLFIVPDVHEWEPLEE